MTRSLKTLGLALVAALALSVLTASVASAAPAHFTANVGAGEQAEIHGEQQAGTNDTFTIEGLPPMTCATVTETGFPEHKVSGVETHTVGPSATSVTFTPAYNTCHIKLGVLTRTVTVTHNGCRFTFTATKNTNAHNPSNLNTPFSADLTVCPGGEKIEIHVYNTSNHIDTGAATLCTYDVQGDQTFNNQIELTNIAGTPHDVTADINVTGITVHATILSATCGLDTHKTATYTGAHTLRATNVNSVFVNTTVS